MLRNVLAVIAGLFVGGCLNMGIIELNSTVLYPMPEGLDMSVPEQFNAYLATLPAAAFVVVMVAHLAQAAVGGWIAARLAASRPRVLAMIVGVFALAGGIAMMIIIDSPAWMMIELPLYLALAWGAGTFELKRRAAAPAAS